MDRANPNIDPTRIKDLYSMVSGIAVSGQGALLRMESKSEKSLWVLKVFNPFNDKVRFKRGAAREYMALKVLNDRYADCYADSFPVVAESNVKTYDSASSVNTANPGYVVLSFIDGCVHLHPLIHALAPVDADGDPPNRDPAGTTFPSGGRRTHQPSRRRVQLSTSSSHLWTCATKLA